MYCNFHTGFGVGIGGETVRGRRIDNGLTARDCLDAVRRTEDTRADKEIEQGKAEWQLR
jgi:hypothetical protein